MCNVESLPIFVGGQKGIGPIEFEVVVAGPNDVGSVIGSLSKFLCYWS